MTYQASILEDGQIVLPAELGRELGLAPGDHLVAEHDGATITIKPYSQVVREVQARFRELVGDYDGSMVDELIADRRTEAEREEAEYQQWARDVDRR